MLQSMGSQEIRHDWMTEQQQTPGPSDLARTSAGVRGTMCAIKGVTGTGKKI